MNGRCDTHTTGDNNGGSDKVHNKVLIIKRRMYTRDELNKAYPIQNDGISFTDIIKDKCQCSLSSAGKLFLGYFPIVGAFRRYNWRNDVVSDVIAGVCTTFLQIPQGFAISLLASLPPVYGLYTTLFSVLTYWFFGTSRHTSVGTNALISLLIAGIINNHLEIRDTHQHDATTILPITTTTSGVGTVVNKHVGATSSPEEQLVAFKVDVASSIALLSGLYLTVAGLLKFGFVTSYLSSAFVGGFTTATAVHIVTSQVSKLLNIQVKPHSGVGKVIKIYIDIFEHIGDANPADVIISVISLAFLYLVTVYINERYNEKLKMPVPVQMILVVISTAISHFASLEDRFGVVVIGDIPSGLPGPSLPHPSRYPGIAYDSFMVALLTFTISISLAKMTAKLHNDVIDTDQEFLAYGLSSIVCSFFSSFTPCNAPPRVMVLSNVGAKSTFHAFICSILLIIVLLVASPLFYALPVSVLAAMICVAIKNILLQITKLPFLWRTSKTDFIVWLLTCLVSVFCDLDIGIVAGIFISFLIVIVKSQLVSGTTGAFSSSEDLIHLNKNRGGIKAPHDFAIFYFPSQLYFANAEKFRKDLFSKIYDPREHVVNYEKNVSKWSDAIETNDETIKINNQNNSPQLLQYIILECSAMTYVDLDGADMIKFVSCLYHTAGIKLLLANCPDFLLNLVEKIGYFQDVSRDTVFYDVCDAVAFIKQNKDTLV